MATFDSATIFTLDGSSSSFFQGNGGTTSTGTASLRSGTSAPYTFKIKNDQGTDLGTAHDFLIDYNTTDGWHIKDVSPIAANPHFYYIGSYPSTATQTQVSVANGTVVLFGSSADEYFRLTFAGLSSGSGGGGFLGGGTNDASGSITRFGSSITWSIDLTSPSSSLSDSYSLHRDGIPYYSNGITHSNGQHTTVTIPTQVGTWKLWHQDASDDTELDSLTVDSLTKSVFCNFW